MVAIFVHEVVGVAFELFTELFHDFIYVLLCEICGAQNNGLLEFECLSQFSGISRVDFKDATERVWMPPVCKFSAIDLNA